jgi:hypothetical protein
MVSSSDHQKSKKIPILLSCRRELGSAGFQEKISRFAAFQRFGVL